MDETRIILVIIAIAVTAFRLYIRLQRQPFHQRLVRQSSNQMHNYSPKASSKTKEDGINIGLSIGAETADGKVFEANGIVLVDVKKSTQSGSTTSIHTKPKMEQTQIALSVVVNHAHEFIGTVSSTQISSNYQKFAEELENSTRDRLDSEGFSLNALLLFNHSIEAN